MHTVMSSWSPMARAVTLCILVLALGVCDAMCTEQIHGWCLCLAWGWFIPAGIVIASFRSLTRPGSNWWYYLHISFQIIGLLLSLAGITVGTYFPANEKLMVQHKKIGIVVNVVAGLQVIFGIVARPPKTSMVRRAWNLMHWTLGRAVLALAIANIFIGFYLSNIAHRHIIAQAVVLGGLFIMYMLKNDIEYLLIRKSPAEEERLLLAAQQPGVKQFNVEMGDAMAHTNGHSNGHTDGGMTPSFQNGDRTMV